MLSFKNEKSIQNYEKRNTLKMNINLYRLQLLGKMYHIPNIGFMNQNDNNKISLGMKG